MNKVSIYLPIYQSIYLSMLLCGPRGVDSNAVCSVIIYRLSGVGSRGQQPKQGSPDFPLPSHFIQLFRWDPEVFPGQPKDIVPPACPGSSRAPPTSGTCPEHITREASGGHPSYRPEPPQLTPLGVEEQRLYFEIFPDGRASHPISKGKPGHPAEETHFSRLYPRSCSFGHYPKLVTISEGRNEDQPVNRELCLSPQLPLCPTDWRRARITADTAPIRLSITPFSPHS